MDYRSLMFKYYLHLIIFIFFIQNTSLSETIKVFDFTEEELKILKVKKVKGETTWLLGVNENGNYIKADAEGKGSGLGKEIKINLLETPYINITWKVEQNLKGIDERTKKGHDYAARVFVIKKTGKTPLSNRAINYVFSSNNSVNEYWPSPYTKKSIDYVLATTENNKNEWVTVKANVKEHFKKLHNLNVKEISGIAIMTDTDNSKFRAISYYQNIFFSSK